MAVDENGNQIIEPSSEPSEAQKRITQLSEKVRLTSEERDEKEKLLKAETEKSAGLEKERNFYQGFSDIVSTNPAAKDHRDEILSKVKGGYTVEDATFAVLGKAGKLGQQVPIAEPTNPAGGSATTVITNQAEKSLSEMTREEKRSALIENQAQIAEILAPQMRM